MLAWLPLRASGVWISLAVVVLCAGSASAQLQIPSHSIGDPPPVILLNGPRLAQTRSAVRSGDQETLAALSELRVAADSPE